MTNNQVITTLMPSTYSLQHLGHNEGHFAIRPISDGLDEYRNITEYNKVAIRSMTDGPKDGLSKDHPRKYSLPLLQRMLPMLAEDSNSV